MHIARRAAALIEVVLTAEPFHRPVLRRLTCAHGLNPPRHGL